MVIGTGQNGTWIVPALRRTYTEWHHAGVAHSVETWVDGRLVGGLYGVALRHLPAASLKELTDVLQ